VIEGARERVNVVASLPGWWGYEYAGEARPRFRLLPDRDIVVDAIGIDGKPVGSLPVTLRYERYDDSLGVLRTVSDPVTGRAVFRHGNPWFERTVYTTEISWPRTLASMQSSLTRIYVPGRLPEEYVSPVYERGLGENECWEAIDDSFYGYLEFVSAGSGHACRAPIPDPPPHDAFRFVASEGADLLLAYSFGAGVIPFEPSEVQLASTGARLSLTGGCWSGRKVLRARLSSSEAGRNLTLRVRRNAISDWLSSTLPDTSLYKHGAIEAKFGTSARTYRIRATIDGAAVPEESIEAQSHGQFKTPRRATLTTDSNGDVLIDVVGGQERVLVLSHRLPSIGGRITVECLGGSQAHRIEVATETPPWSELEIVDERDVPASGAEVEAQPGAAESEEHGKRRFRFQCTFLSFESDGDESEAGIGGPPDETSLSDSQGRGVLLATEEHWAGGRAWEGSVEASAPGHRSAAQSVATSTTHLRFVLERRAALHGYLRTSDPASAENLNLLLLRREDGVSETHAPGVTLGCSCDGRFEFDELRPAEYTLIVRRVVSGARPVELARRDKFVLMPGQVLDLGEIVID
jgi:hypothetical protein